MTIAACYLSDEGAVLGADSTTTMFVPVPGERTGSVQQYNFAQKIFEFGDAGSTVGVVLWGLGSVGSKSYRTLVAEMADRARTENLTSLGAVAELAAGMHWEQYSSAFAAILPLACELDNKGQKRTPEEENEWLQLQQALSGGFCLAGRWGRERQPAAFEMEFGPFQTAAPQPQPLTLGGAKFWGWSNLIERLTFGADYRLFSRILESGKWSGDPKDLALLLVQDALGQPSNLPLREAIDWIHASIYTTIKAMKFSHLAPVCGGPIEIAVITTDRPFRWVRHKQLGAAISAHQIVEDWPHWTKEGRR